MNRDSGRERGLKIASGVIFIFLETDFSNFSLHERCDLLKCVLLFDARGLCPHFADAMAWMIAGWKWKTHRNFVQAAKMYAEKSQETNRTSCTCALNGVLYCLRMRRDALLRPILAKSNHFGRSA